MCENLHIQMHAGYVNLLVYEMSAINADIWNADT